MSYKMKSAGSVLAALLAVAAPRAWGQAGSTADAAPDSKQDETIVLSPFTVNSSEGEGGYAAQSTLAGSRVRTDLRDVGSAISVVTTKFLQDTGATDNQSLLQYTTNTEVGGLGGNFSGLGNGSSTTETGRLIAPNNETRVRGLDAADNTRDYFLTDIPWDGYNIDRVELQRGPNSVLFGVGSPAGIINTTLSTASFKDSFRVENRIASFGTVRNSFSFNKVLLDDELAIRVNGLENDQKFQQSPAFDNNKRLYAALRYDPKFLRGDTARTSFRINAEYGKTSADRPRTLPPIDTITPWFQTAVDPSAPTVAPLNKRTFDPAVESQVGGLDNGNTLYPWFNQAFVGRQYGPDAVYYYPNSSASAPSAILQSMTSTNFGIGPTGAVDQNIGGLAFFRPLAITNYSAYATTSGLPGAQYGLWKDKSLTDPTIFDFYHKLIDGPNSHQAENWHTVSANASQTFLDNRLAFEVAYDHQDYKNSQEQVLDAQQYTIGVDINQYLDAPATAAQLAANPNQPNLANPNVGRPYVASAGLYGNQSNHSVRDDLRGTLTGELRASDFFGNTALADALGHHQLTFLGEHDVHKLTQAAWDRNAYDQDWANTLGNSNAITDTGRQVDWVTYLGPSLLGANSASGANIDNLQTLQQRSGLSTVQYFDSHWNAATTPGTTGYVDPAAPYTDRFGNVLTQSENPANYVGWTTKTFNILNADQGDIQQLYRSGSKVNNVVDSGAFTWQGFFLDDALIPTFGYRKDTVRIYSASAPLDPGTGVAEMNYNVPGAYSAKATGTSRTYDLVARLPKSWRQKLPGGLDFSLFYNKSQNFKADTVRVDVVGNNLPNAEGKTKEYGFTVSALDDRVSLKVDFYKTTVTNATLGGANAGLGSNLYWLWAANAWGAATSAINLNGLATGTGHAGSWDYASTDLGKDAGGNPVLVAGTFPRPAAAATIDASEKAASLAFINNLPSQSFFDAYGLPVNVAALQAGNYNSFGGGFNILQNDNGGSLQPAGGGNIRGQAPVATVDTISKGVEIELTAKITKNWDVSVNASKTQASRENLSSTVVGFINNEKTIFDGPAGDLRVWGGGDAFDTIRQQFTQNIYGPYLALLAQEGTQAPEIRPWHVNAITNYSFNQGPVKGFNVGGAVRWDQGEILGYGLDANQNIDVNKVYRGESETGVDLWVGYTRKITNKIDWRIQLNARDVGQKARLIPISVEPDGSPAAFRIADGTTWQLTNTFSF